MGPASACQATPPPAPPSHPHCCAIRANPLRGLTTTQLLTDVAAQAPVLQHFARLGICRTVCARGTDPDPQPPAPRPCRPRPARRGPWAARCCASTSPRPWNTLRRPPSRTRVRRGLDPGLSSAAPGSCLPWKRPLHGSRGCHACRVPQLPARQQPRSGWAAAGRAALHTEAPLPVHWGHTLAAGYELDQSNVAPHGSTVYNAKVGLREMPRGHNRARPVCRLRHPARPAGGLLPAMRHACHS